MTLRKAHFLPAQLRFASDYVSENYANDPRLRSTLFGELTEFLDGNHTPHRDLIVANALYTDQLGRKYIAADPSDFEDTRDINDPALVMSDQWFVGIPRSLAHTVALPVIGEELQLVDAKALLTITAVVSCCFTSRESSALIEIEGHLPTYPSADRMGDLLRAIAATAF